MTALVLVLFLLACLPLSFPGTAEAEVVHFQEPSPISLLNGSGSGLTIQAPSGIAIDESTGKVFLNDENVVGGTIGPVRLLPLPLSSILFSPGPLA